MIDSEVGLVTSDEVYLIRESSEALCSTFDLMISK
jgi:hypothetical protein